MQAEQKQCPACSGKIVQDEAPSCPYCGHALGGAAVEGPNTARLGRMRGHDQFAGALEWSPTGVELANAARRARWGWAMVVGGLVLALITFGDWNFFLIGFGAVLVVTGVRRIAESAKVKALYGSHPLARRPAIVTDRRSETAFNGWSGRVTYFFVLEFDDGLQGEFRFPGRGWPHEPLAKGATGVAYTRGAQLVEFKPIKV